MTFSEWYWKACNENLDGARCVDAWQASFDSIIWPDNTTKELVLNLNPQFKKEKQS